MSLFEYLFSKPLSTQLTITSQSGFHLRPIAQFVALCKTFPAKITLLFNDKRIEATSVPTLLSLSLEQGDTFTLQTRGKQAQQAMEALTTLFTQLMQEEKAAPMLQYDASTYQGAQHTIQSITDKIAIAPAVSLHITQKKQESTHSFDEACRRVLQDLEQNYQNQKEHSNATIYLAQKALLEALYPQTTSFTQLKRVVQQEIHALQGTQNAAKEADYLDILSQIEHYLGKERHLVLPNTPSIVMTDALLPSHIPLLLSSNVQGVILYNTSPYAHTAILLRAEGIPAAITTEAQAIPHTHPIILDGKAGVIVTAPTTEDIKEASTRQTRIQDATDHAFEKRFEPAYTTQGKKIQLFANISDPASAHVAKEAGAEGIGLLRSEFLFTQTEPSLEQQRDAYREIFSLFDEITVRTLDVGGDKSLPYLSLPQEQNPFLGIRGVRLFQTHPEILERQLHALFLAAEGRAIKIMFPMVSTVEEFTTAKFFAQKIAQKHQIDISKIAFGMMIEVPSVLFLLDAFNDVVDFYSIGTNDLVQYLFAIERTHPTLHVAPLSPVIFRALEQIMQQSTKPVSLCGELASNAEAIPKLLELGLSTLSVSSKTIAPLKEIIRHV